MPNNIEHSARIHVTLVILSLIGIVLALISTSRYGVGLSTDSASYISAARSLLAGNGYLYFDGRLFVAFPPLFPTVLAILGLIGIEPLDGARFVNAFVFGLIIFTSGKLFQMAIKSKAIVILGTVSILFSYPLLRVSTYAWSEPLFVLLAILFIIYIPRFLNVRGFVTLFSLSILAALSCLQRYMGVTIILTGFALIIFLTKAHLRERLKYAIVFGVMSITPCVIWILRNYMLTSRFTGTRPPSQRTLLLNTFSTLRCLTTWFVPYEVPFWIRLIGIGFVVSILTAVARFLHYRLKSQTTFASIQVWSAAVFVLIYTIFLIASSTSVAIDAISDRLLAPIYVFVMYLVFICMDRFSQPIEIIYPRTFFSYWHRLIPIAMILSGVVANEFVLTRYVSSDGVLKPTTISNIRQFQAVLLLTGILLLTRRQIAVAYKKIVVRVAASIKASNPLNRLLRKNELRNFTVIGLCIIWLMCPFVRVSKELLDWTCSGAGGYNTPTWRESSLMEWIRTHPLEGRVYSNAPDAIYILTGMSARMSPRKDLYNSTATTTDNISKFRKLLTSETDTYLAWFENKKKAYLYNIEELSSSFAMEILATCSDGSVYFIK